MLNFGPPQFELLSQFAQRNAVPPPTLLLDFTSTTTDLFSRGSDGTYWDASGTLQTATADGPRFDHDPLTGEALGQLVEPDRTNVFRYSNDFSVWSKSGASVSGSLITATATTCAIYQNITVAIGSNTIYFDVSLGDATFCAVRVQSFDVEGLVWFDLSSGTVMTEEAGLSGIIRQIGATTYRCAVTFSTTTSLSGRGYLYLCDGDGSKDVTIGKTLTVYRAQCEDGPIATSYIQTASGPVTRAADITNIAAATMPFNPLGMGFALEGDMTYVDANNAAELTFFQWKHSSTNFIQYVLSTASSRTGQPIAQQRTTEGGAFSASGDTGVYSPGILVPFSIASRHGPTFLQGAAEGASFSPTVEPAEIYDLSATDFQVAPVFNGHLRTLRVWGQPISTAVIEGATS